MRIESFNHWVIGSLGRIGTMNLALMNTYKKGGEAEAEAERKKGREMEERRG